jgi:hypothetical protein
MEKKGQTNQQIVGARVLEIEREERWDGSCAVPASGTILASCGVLGKQASGRGSRLAAVRLRLRLGAGKATVGGAK